MAQFFLVRHAQASLGAANYDQLSPLGHQQARWLGEYYRERDILFDALVTGDLVRHAETGRAILAGLGTSLTADIQPGLNEFDFHSIVDAYLRAYPDETPPENAPVVAFYRVLKKAMMHWRDNTLETALSESWQDFKDRVAGVMAYVQAHYSDHERVLVVTSGGVIAMWLGHILQTADQTVVDLNLQIRNASVTEGFFNPKVFRLSAFNQVPHLDRADRLALMTYS